MSDNKMTPEWVVRNFLPDYEKRFKSMFHPNSLVYRVDRSFRNTYKLWVDRHFPEALENLLKEQRRTCAENFQYADDYYSAEINAIQFAGIPEPINNNSDEK